MADPTAATLLVSAVVGLPNVAVLVWAVRRVQAHSEEMRAIRVTLWGEQGDNGIAGNMKGLLKWQPRASARLTRLEERVKLPPIGDVT